MSQNELIRKLTSSNSKLHSSSSPGPNVSVSLIFAVSGSSPYALRFRASSVVYFWITSALSSWKSRNEIKMMSPWLIQTWQKQCGPRSEYGLESDHSKATTLERESRPFSAFYLEYVPAVSRRQSTWLPDAHSQASWSLERILTTVKGTIAVLDHNWIYTRSLGPREVPKKTEQRSHLVRLLWRPTPASQIRSRSFLDDDSFLPFPCSMSAKTETHAEREIEPKGKKSTQDGEQKVQGLGPKRGTINWL